MIATMVWSICIGIQSVVYTTLGDTKDALFSLGCGALSWYSYETQKSRG